MERYQSAICILFVCILGILLPIGSYGQLSGNYTINPTKAASNSNYLDWTSAIGDLVSGSRTDGGTAQGSGVSGPVIISVYDTLYDNTSLNITSISGTSYSNTIVFKSLKGDSSKCLLRYASGTAATDDYVVFLNGADYISFRQIGMERTGTNTYSTVVQIGNDADNNKFIHCLMKARKMPSSSSLGFNYGIGSCVYFTGNGDSAEFNQNRMLYGYNGVYNANSCTGVYYYKNVIDTSGSAGIYTTGQTALRISGNILNLGDFGAGSGHYTSYALRVETSPGLVINNNKISMTAVNAQVCRALVIASNTSSAAAPAMIYNNSIYNSGGTGSCTGLAVYNCYYMNFFYNNVLINNSLAEGAAYFQYSGTYTNSNLNLVNNNLINKGAGYAVDVRDAVNYANIDSLDYNNIYSAGTYSSYWNTVKYSSLSSFQSASGKVANCLSLDPGFVSNSDLHVSNIAINGKAMPYPKILFDIDNESRNSSTPDIGSDEFFPITLDAGISAVDSPSLFCAGKQNVKIRFQNYGIDTIKNLTIAWTLNGSAQSNTAWTGKVAPGASSPAVVLGAFTFAGNTAYAFKVWSTKPNGSNDGKNNNDTLKVTKYAAMSGAYTIGDTNVSNYKSFSQAVTAMTERGICGAVTFNVFNGTYNEQLGIAQLAGMGVNSPVVFQSVNKDSSKVKISLASTIANGSNNAALQLRGADYVTFKGITFERTGTNIYAQVIHILNGSNHNTFANCRMIGLSLTNANASAINIWSDQGIDNYNVFRNNAILYGHQSMNYQGTLASHEKATTIVGNVFSGAYKNALQLSYNDSAIIRNNIFQNVNVADTGTNDIYMQDCDMAIEINGNLFKDNNTQNAIYLNGCNATSTMPGVIANNMIIKPSGRGISFDAIEYQNIVFNSIYFNSNLATNAGINSNKSSASNIVLRNNNIVMEGGEVVHLFAANHISVSNNNNFYAKGTQFAYWGVSYSDLSSLTAATSKDGNSFSIDPMFKSGTDLHIINPNLKSVGSPITGVTVDFDGEIRNSITPDIGADEFKLSNNDAGIVAITKPLNGTCAGRLDVEAVIKNSGNDTLKTAIIQWWVNGVAQNSFSWKGQLATNKRDTVVIGDFNFIGITNPKFIVKAILPNGQSDAIAFNDSIILNRTIRALPVANAGANQSVCLGDSILIGTTFVTGLTYQWTNLANSVIGTSAQIYAKPKVNSTYILEVTNSATGCAKMDSVDVIINSKPIADAGSDVAFCPGGKATIGKAAQTGFTYSWTSIPSGYASSSANPIVSPKITTTYLLKKTIVSTGCSANDTVKVTVNPVPISIVTGSNSVCNGDNVTYNAKLNTGNIYAWSAIGGNIISGKNTNSVLLLWDTIGTGVLQVIEGNAFGCKDTTTYNVAVNDKPKAAFSVLSGLCKGDATSFKDNSTSATTFAWSFGDAGTSTIQNPTHIYAAATNYTVRLAVSNGGGCKDTVWQPLQIQPLPVAWFTFIKKGNRTVEFTDSSNMGSGSINQLHWEFGDGDTTTEQNPSHQYSTDGNYIVRLCATSIAGCKTCIDRNLNVLGLQNANYTKAIYAIPNPSSGVFVIAGIENFESIEITNAIGQIVEFYTLPGNELEIDLTPQLPGIYFVKITVGNQSQVIKLVKG